ncbi:MAG: iron-containing redox enzyme family protein [Deltaproteobacteria bacterium]|nr:iron-containing redox enzyme family protein [Deltaproteobacteria bacterium]
MEHHKEPGPGPISVSIKARIERHAELAYRTNPLFARAERGEVSMEHIARYLRSLHHLFSMTVPYLKAAEAGALERGNPKLARFFREKIGEEAGHDEWARADFESVPLDAGTREAIDVLPTMKAFLAHVREMIAIDPAFYVAYAMTAEYFTVLVAPRWVAALHEKCGIDPRHMSAIAKHAELDKDHADEDMRVLDELLPPSESWDLGRLLASVDRTIEIFDEFGHDVFS